ncbi:hypothetical protein AGABI2DRAFT_116205 [Agaricus bisporus var. bisporus H97]|uniref:hypothetical protein n=1 Tax=Agaricus bisporus var. bisporus (strain H97 / ATCC MYA-4626 / FGSC 10389) TaxID=936046 RepID=UPI00029F72F1|nr:hypothetical protein AGABI2DRAFT_116205 [Agaricus bisporus var. bisporus H97]EKV49150.1 hypothetical protein AGABI2DRAFT_116205 [Agaricus bisporus var. bisporus H97]
MIFSRVSIEFGSSHPPSSTLKLLINDEVGDVDLQKLSDEEINRLGYFRLADASPCPGVFSSTITSLAVRETQDGSSLPNPSPPIRLTRNSDSSPNRLSKPEFLGTSPSWASQGLCIDGFSSPAEKRIVPGESLGDIANSPLASSTDHDDFPSPASSFSDRFVFPPSPEFEIPSSNSPFDDDEEEEIFPVDFVGVFNVGYPLRPSRARYDLVGLGLPSNVIPDDRRERFGEPDPASPDLDELLPSLASSRRSSRHKRSISCSNSYPNSAAIAKSPRQLFSIAEEDSEDRETPRSTSLPCIRHTCSQLSGSSNYGRTPPWNASDELLRESNNDNITLVYCSPPFNI